MSTFCSISKASYVRLYYVNQNGIERSTKPNRPTVNGRDIAVNELAAWHPLHKHETMLERAVRLKLLDTWTARLEVCFNFNNKLVFKGEKAIKLWKTFVANVKSKNQS